MLQGIGNGIFSLERAISKSRALEVFAIRERWSSPQREYYDPLIGTEVLGCVDVRDRVYAMISLMDPQRRLTADYGLSTHGLCARVVGSDCVDAEVLDALCVKLNIGPVDR